MADFGSTRRINGGKEGKDGGGGRDAVVDDAGGGKRSKAEGGVGCVVSRMHCDRGGEWKEAIGKGM